MLYRELGKSGINASVVGIGTWSISGWRWGGAQLSDSIKAMHASFDAGVNFIDTAPVYGLGYAEKIVSESIKGRRNKVVIATKCGLRWDKTKDSDEIESTIHTNLNPKSIKYELEKSLKRLGTDYIDLYQTHWPDKDTPIAETMNTLIKLKNDGYIRAIGVSNVSKNQLKQYVDHGVIDTDQEKYNMIERQSEKENIPFCIDNNISFIAYSPLAQGLLTGKCGPERNFSKDDDRSTDPLFSVKNRKRIHAKLVQSKPIADKYDLTLSQLAISRALAQKGITHVLCGARTDKQALENAKSAAVNIDKQDMEEDRKSVV